MIIKFIKRKLFHLSVLTFLSIVLLSYSVLIQPINCQKSDFIIPQGSSLPYVISELEDCGCLSNGVYLKYMMIITNKDTKIKPGKYNLSEAKNNYELAKLITSSNAKMIDLTILEGWTLEQISKTFSDSFSIDEEKFKRLCSDKDYIESLGIDANSLEGYLYPETYMFSEDFVHSQNKEAEIISTLVGEFKRSYRKAVRSRREHSLTMHEIVTMASIVQGECVYSSEMDTVSSVYHNRLDKGMLLQADPTIQYIIPGPNKRLYNKDYSRYEDNPYNTYSHRGLPPGPINSPGFEALKAAAYPAQTDFIFFVAKGNNQHHFTTNERDHINAKNKFLKKVWAKP